MSSLPYIPSKASDLKDANGLSLQTLLNTQVRVNLDTINGVYVPLFQSATQLSKITNTFAIAPGGGLIAGVNGTSSTGVIWLPAPIDNSKPWRFAVLLQAGTDSTNICKVELVNSAVANSSFSVAMKNNALTVTAGVTQQVSMTSNAPTNGQQFWFTATNDGTNVTYSVLPVGGAGVVLVPSGIIDGTVENVKQVPNNLVLSAVGVFSGNNQIKITSVSGGAGANIVKGVFFNAGYGGGTDSRMQPPAHIYNVPLTNGETASLIRIPGSYTGRTPADIVQFLHYNNTDFMAGQLNTNPDAGAAMNYLVQQGYIVCACRGTNDAGSNALTATAAVANGQTAIPVQATKGGIASGAAITWPSGAITTTTAATAPGVTSIPVSATWTGTGSATIALNDVSTPVASTTSLSGKLASNWGAQDGLAYRKALTDWVRANLPNTRNLYLIGGSMGGMNALNYALQYPGSVRAMILLTPATNLSYSYSTEGFGTVINTAYTSLVTGLTATVVGDVKDRDPILRTYDLINVPMKIWAASDDVTLSYAQHTTAFISAMATAGVTVPVVITTGGHVPSNPNVFDGPNFAAFFRANP